MAGYPEDTTPASWHRYFAIESNNRAWDLTEKRTRTSEETIEMSNAAHAAAWHWSLIGDESNRMRARTLLALVHTLAGSGESALRLAEEVRSYFAARETDDWETALVHSIHAYAAARVGDAEAHRGSYEAAQRALAAAHEESDPDEREIVLQTFSQVPPP